jgi:branched-chain amino acid transport system substrate-binding protein
MVRPALGVALALGMAGAAEAAPADIIVGAPNALTGGFGEASQHVVEGLTVAVDQINNAGGIKSLGGAKIKLIPADTSDKPDQAASVTRRLITQDHAVILVGANTSAMTMSAQIEAEKGRVPIITTSYADPIVQRGMKYTFKVPPQNAITGAFTVQYAAKLWSDATGHVAKTIGVYHGSDAASTASSKGTLAEAKKDGLKVVSQLAFQGGLTDPTAVLSAVLQSRPDLIFFSSITADTILVTKALRGVGIKSPVVSGGGSVSSNGTGSALGTAASGLMGVVSFNWDLPIPGVKEEMAAYHKLYPSKPFPPASDTVGLGYAIGMIIDQALEKAASTDPTKIRDVLENTEFHVPLPGGKVDFDQTGLNIYGQPIMVEWIKGELRTIWPKEYQTVKPTF